MAMTIEDFFIGLGFEVDTAGLDELASKIMRASKVTALLASVFVGAAAGVALLAAHSAEALDELGDFAEQEQVSAEMIQELGFAAQMTGSDLNAVKSSISGVNSTLGQAAQGVGRAAAIFKKLGFDARDAQGNVKSFDDFMVEVAKRMEGMSRQEQIALAEKLGFDRSLVPLLTKGRDGIAALRAEARSLGITSEKQIAIASEFQDRIDRLRFAFVAWKNDLAVAVLPWVTRVMDKLREWRPILVEIARALAFVAAGFAALKAIEFLIAVPSQIGKLVGLITKLNPMIIMLGLIAVAIGLIIEDLYTWRQGGESVIGEFLQSNPELLASFTELWESIKRLGAVLYEYVWPIVKMIFQGWGELLKLLLPMVIKLISLLVDGLVWAIEAVANVLSTVINAISSIIETIGEFFDFVGEKMGDIGEFLSSNEGVTATTMIVPGLGPAGMLPPSMLSNGGGSTSSTSSTVNIPGGITVVSPDADRAGLVVREELERMQKSAIRNEQSVVSM